MRLYRGQPSKEASSSANMSPWLLQAIKQRRNEPMGRATGRWFTDDVEIAQWYVADANGCAEIVALEIPDDMAERFRVSNAPTSECGLTPGSFSKDPEREFFLPREIAEGAVVVQTFVDGIGTIMDNSHFGGKNMAEPAITYEGIDHREHDEQFRRDFSLPGDKVRLDPKVNIANVDIKDLGEKLGEDVLTISKTIMTGKHDKDIVGGERTYVIPTYEFEGVEGQFPAKAFQHELGDHGATAVIAAREDKLWLVPMASDSREMTGAAGPAREIVGFAGKHQADLDPEGVPGMIAYAAEKGPQLGDFYYRSATTFEDKSGPVNLLASPWMANADAKEADIAGRAINVAVFERSVDDVVAKSNDLLKVHGSWDDGQEPSEVNDLLNSIYARKQEPSLKNSGGVLDAADAMLGMLDDRSMSSGKAFDDLATSVDHANKAADEILRHRYDDMGITPALARDIEKIADAHDKAMDAAEARKPSPAALGAMAGLASRGM